MAFLVIDPTLPALLTGISATIAAAGGIVAAVLSYLNRDKIREVHIALNSRLDELISASEDKGRIAERHEQRESLKTDKPEKG